MLDEYEMALEPLRRMLAADGYLLHLESRAALDDQLTLTVKRGPTPAKSVWSPSICSRTSLHDIWLTPGCARLSLSCTPTPPESAQSQVIDRNGNP